MADWDTSQLDSKNIYADLSECSRQPSGSRKSSLGSGISTTNGVNDDDSDDFSSFKNLVLRGGENLKQESQTDQFQPGVQNLSFTETNGVHIGQTHLSAPGTAKARALKSPYAPSTADSIPEEEISIPNDGNLSTFSKEDVANFLRCLKVDDRIISHLYRKNVDGKRFSRLKDSELENVNLKNPVIMFFRDKSSAKNKKGAGSWFL